MASLPAGSAAAGPGPGPEPGPAKLMDLADAVVYGTVGPGTTVESATPGTPVDTLYPVKVERAIKGAPGKTVTVRVGGGELGDGTAVWPSEQPRLRVGERFLLFLDGNGEYRAVDGHVGAIAERIVTNDGLVRNPVFTSDPTTMAADGGTCSYPASYAGFALWMVDGKHIVWPTGETATMYVNAGFTANASAVDAAFAAWNGGGGAFTLVNGGPTAASPEVHTDPISAIGWGTTTLSSSNAETYPRVVVETGQILNMDIVFNSAKQSQFTVGTALPSSGQIDLQSVMTHEAGHVLGFDHINNVTSPMRTCVAGDEPRRTLGSGDRAGHKNFYPPDLQGYWLLDQSGAVYGLGGYGSLDRNHATYYGNAVGLMGSATAVDIEMARPTRNGYSILASNGGVFAYGGARFHGSAVSHLCSGCTAKDLAVHPTGDAYWVLGSNGSVYAYPVGSAPYHGNATAYLPSGVTATGIAAKPAGGGYWIVSSTGSVYAFGSASYYGGGSIPSYAQPVVSIVPTQSGNGYWLLGTNGQVFNFGDAAAYSGPALTSAKKSSRGVTSAGLVNVSGSGVTSFVGPITDYGSGTTATPYTGVSTVFPAVAPTLNVTSTPATVNVPRGATRSATLALVGNETFFANVSFTIGGAPAGIGALVTPNPVLVPAGTANATLSVTVPTSYLGTGFTLAVTACGQGICRTLHIPVVVTVA